jgi:hypothetical protein
MDDHEPRIGAETAPRCIDSLRVAVDREQAPSGTEGLEDARRMPAAAEGRVDEEAVACRDRRVRAEAKTMERFFDKHRDVLIQVLPPRDVRI